MNRASRHLLKREPSSIDPVISLAPDEREDDRVFRGIRCPLCAWQPQASSLWCCDASESPEPFFPGCGTHWNTFATRGRCPGCQHQWKWTSCLRCAGWSPHEDWYEQQDD